MKKKTKIIIAIIVFVIIVSVAVPISVYYGSYCTVRFECGFYKNYETSVKYKMDKYLMYSEQVKRATYYTPQIPHSPIIHFQAPIRYEFSGWYLDSALTKPYETQRIKRDMTLYAKWIEIER